MSYVENDEILKIINPIRNPTRTGNQRISGINTFVKELESEAVLNLNPEYQRGIAWSNERQTSFMENILREMVTHHTNIIRFNDPSLAFLHGNKINAHSDLPNQTMCIDGLQRFTAMQRYMQGELKPFGLSFDEIESTYHGVKARGLTYTVAWYDFQFEHEVIELYQAINWGGVPHSESEFERVNLCWEKAHQRRIQIENSIK